MRRVLCAALTALLFIGGFGVDTFAKEDVQPTDVITEDSASDVWTAALRGAYLGNGTSTITREDSTHINISGATTCTKTCDKVVLTLYVERSKSYATGYSTYKSYKYNDQNVYQLVKGISNIPVERGYYYRVKGVHSVTHNGTTETNNSVTNPIDYR